MTSPNPIQVTPEMRDAVYAEDCKQQGHIISIENMFQTSDEFTLEEKHAPDVQGPDNQTFAYVYCRRCGRVWIVLEDSGRDYAEAEKKFKKLLKQPDQDTVVIPKRKDEKHTHGIPVDHSPTPEELGKPKG